MDTAVNAQHGAYVHLQSNLSKKGELVALEEYGSGHIHDTYRGVWQSANGARTSLLHQCINTRVFPNALQVTRSIALAGGLMEEWFRAEEILDYVPQVLQWDSGLLVCEDENGASWRTMTFIENTYSCECAPSPSEAFEAAAAFGRFQRGLNELSLADFPDCIPGFHSSMTRYGQLCAALEAGKAERILEARGLMELVEQLRPRAERIEEALTRGDIPWRVAHNDTKINNVLFSCQTKKAVAVVDLDLLQAGSPLFDLGDLLRSAGAPVAEDESDLTKVVPDKDLVDNLVRGYCGALGDALTAIELTLLPEAAVTLCWLIGVRFLADYCNGDVYFKTSYEKQNLQRAKVQLTLASAYAAYDFSRESPPSLVLR